MADRLRIVNFSAGGRPQTIVDLNDGTNVTLIRDTLKVTPPQSTQQLADSQRRYGGGYIAAETHANGGFEAEWYVTDTTADAQLVRLEALLGILQQPAQGRYVEWRPEGATRSVFYEIRGPGQWEPTYRWIVYQQSKTIQLKAALVVGPLAEGSRMDVWDDFSVDSSGDYTYDSGSSGINTISSDLQPNGSLTTERRMIHTERGYTFTDVQAQVKATVGASISSSYKAGAVICRTASNNYIEAYVDDNGTNSRLRIDKVVAGSRTNLTSTNLANRVNASPYNVFWVRLRREGPVVTAEHFASTAPDPGAGMVATTTNNVALSSAEQTAFPAGYAGIVWVPIDATARLDDFKVEPYTYLARTAAEEIDLPAIPGTAPAKVDILTTQTAGTQGIWASFGWQPKPAPWNYVQRGDFEDQTSATDIIGWSTAAVSSLTAASTSITGNATTAKYGQNSAVVTIPATALSAVNYPIYRRFRKGVTYTIRAWVARDSGAASCRIGIGNSGGTDSAVTAYTALASTAFQELTTTWTPTADRDVAYFFAGNDGTAAANVFRMDGVQVFEGTTVPATGRQAEGHGAHPPFGYIEAEQYDYGLSGWTAAPASDTQQRNGYKLTVNTTPNVAGSLYSEYFIDPSLVAPDSFSSGEYFFEVWAAAGVGNAGSGLAVRATAAIRPEAIGTSGTSGTRYSLEFGSAGKLIPYNGVADTRLYRLGTFSVPVDAYQARWILGITWAYPATAGGVTHTFDHLLLLPVRRRAASPSGKANDSSYPKFVTSATGAKLITSDLRGYASYPTTLAFPLGYAAARTTGLSGSQIEMDPGDTRVVTRISREVADVYVPSGTATAGAELTGSGETFRAAYHFAVQPRYFLGRGA